MKTKMLDSQGYTLVTVLALLAALTVTFGYLLNIQQKDARRVRGDTTQEKLTTALRGVVNEVVGHIKWRSEYDAPASNRIFLPLSSATENQAARVGQWATTGCTAAELRGEGTIDPITAASIPADYSLGDPPAWPREVICFAPLSKRHDPVIYGDAISPFFYEYDTVSVSAVNGGMKRFRIRARVYAGPTNNSDRYIEAEAYVDVRPRLNRWGLYVGGFQMRNSIPRPVFQFGGPADYNGKVFVGGNPADTLLSFDLRNGNLFFRDKFITKLNTDFDSCNPGPCQSLVQGAGSLIFEEGISTGITTDPDAIDLAHHVDALRGEIDGSNIIELPNGGAYNFGNVALRVEPSGDRCEVRARPYYVTGPWTGSEQLVTAFSHAEAPLGKVLVNNTPSDGGGSWVFNHGITAVEGNYNCRLTIVSDNLVISGRIRQGTSGPDSADMMTMVAKYQVGFDPYSIEEWRGAFKYWPPHDQNGLRGYPIPGTSDPQNGPASPAPVGATNPYYFGSSYPYGIDTSTGEEVALSPAHDLKIDAYVAANRGMYNHYLHGPMEDTYFSGGGWTVSPTGVTDARDAHGIYRYGQMSINGGLYIGQNYMFNSVKAVAGGGSGGEVHGVGIYRTNISFDPRYSTTEMLGGLRVGNKQDVILQSYKILNRSNIVVEAVAATPPTPPDVPENSEGGLE